jgi:hypothetical protein
VITERTNPMNRYVGFLVAWRVGMSMRLNMNVIGGYTCTFDNGDEFMINLEAPYLAEQTYTIFSIVGVSSPKKMTYFKLGYTQKLPDTAQFFYPGFDNRILISALKRLGNWDRLNVEVIELHETTLVG